MKNILKNKLLILLGVLALTFTSCNEDLLELNVDPNNPTVVPAVNIVTQAEFSMNDLLSGGALNYGWTMLLTQHWSENEYGESSRYTVDGNDFNGIWSTFYASILSDLQVAKELIQEDPNVVGGRQANQIAIIDILMVYAYHNLVDAFGDIPYTRALNSTEFPLPAYDDQEMIYKGLLNTVDAAVSSIDINAPSFDAGELIYNGDMSLWRKFGNSLMMRIAMRMVDVDQATASTYVTKAASDMISSNDENALFVFSDNPSLAHPAWRNVNIGNRDDYAVSDVLVDNLKSFGDPRLEVFANPIPSGEIAGMPYGLTDGEAFSLKSTTSRPSDYVRSATFPAVMMDYAEVQFLAAEAFQRELLSGDAAAAYAEGVKASMNYWGISDEAAIDAYVAANAYDAGNWKESLGWQKWIAFYMNGPQAWAEWRRLDYPQLEVPAAATNPVIPVRNAYPVDEQTRNGSSLSAVTSNPDDLSTKMWWDVN